MKKIFLVFSLMLCSLMAMSQVPQGLEGIVVEKYYVANAADHAADPNLAVGAVTYRIYADLSDRWHVLAVYADVAKNQRMIIETNAANGFYNETDNGGALATDITYADLTTGTVMLDSWITLGAAAKRRTTGPVNYYGIPKTLDNGVNNITHSDGLIQNTTGYPAPAVRDQDGYLGVASPNTLVPGNIGADGLIAMIDGSTTNNSVTVTDGSWYNGNPSGGQATGATTDNMVLIGQFTTEGVFHFAVNLLIRNLDNSTLVESHVWENPGVGEFLNADLEQTLGMPATPPTVTNLTVTPGSLIVGGDVNLSVEANDNIAIDSVVFFRGTTRLGRSSSSANPYLFTWTSNATGTFNITAVAYDDEGTPGTSAIVPLVVLPVPLNQPPVVTTLTAPATANIGTSVTISAVATDDVSVANIEYTVLGVTTLVPGASNSYTFTAPATEQYITVQAVAIDNQTVRSAARTAQIRVLDPAGRYEIQSQTVNCNGSDLFYVPVVRKGSAISKVIGFDMVMGFEQNKVMPTGVVRVDRSLIADSTWTSYTLRVEDDSVFISLFFNGTAPLGTPTYFEGSGNVLRVEFAKRPAFGYADMVTFGVNDFVESFNNGTEKENVISGTFTTVRDLTFTGSLKFWADNSAISYVAGTNLITDIRNCAWNQGPVAPGPDGKFNWALINTSSLSINIKRNIANSTGIMAIVGGYDAYLTQRVLVNDKNFKPNVYQMIAMDVNQDRKISAGDLSQIMQRAALKIGEFKQVFNYDENGDQILPARESWDWTFVSTRELFALEYSRISATYPEEDGEGYTKNRLPNVQDCINLNVENFSTCPIVYDEEFQGIMLGDVDGSYKNIAPNTLTKGSKSEEVIEKSASTVDGKVVFDLSKAIVNDGFITFPISLSSETSVNSLDFEMKFDESKLAFKSVFNHLNNLQSLGYYNESDKTLRVTSFSLQNYTKEASVISLRFELKDEKISSVDIKSVTAYLNGNPAGTELTEFDLSAKELDEKILRVFPNPAKSVINVELSENATVQLVDINGKVVLSGIVVNAYQRREISLNGLSQGMYLMKFFMEIGDEEYVATRKIVIKK